MAPHCVILMENALEALEKVGVVVNSTIKAQGRDIFLEKQRTFHVFLVHVCFQIVCIFQRSSHSLSLWCKTRAS